VVLIWDQRSPEGATMKCLNMLAMLLEHADLVAAWHEIQGCGSQSADVNCTCLRAPPGGPSHAPKACGPEEFRRGVVELLQVAG
jgi:hypothetical protein